MYDTDFELYGKQCDLRDPYRGYTRGTIIGRCGYRYVVELSSGARLEFYEDELEFD